MLNQFKFKHFHIAFVLGEGLCVGEFIPTGGQRSKVTRLSCLLMFPVLLSFAYKHTHSSKNTTQVLVMQQNGPVSVILLYIILLDYYH